MRGNRRRKAGASPIKVVRRNGAGKAPGFIFTAEITGNGFFPRKCIGGFTTLTGYPTSSFMKGNFYQDQIVEKIDSGQVRKFRLSTKGDGKPRTISYRLITRSGRRIAVTEQTVVLVGGRSKKLVAGIVTRSANHARKESPGMPPQSRARYEEMEKLNKHLLEVNQLKDEFLANTSHELRTPLNSIIGFLTLITEGYYENEEELRIFTRNALDSSYHLLSVINDLLDVSKIESGRMQLQIEKVYVDEVVEEVSTLFRVQADQKNLVFDCQIKDSPLYASADVRKLKQVLINLAGNALKFTQTGSIRILVESVGGQLKFTIKDTGVGIPKDKHDMLFQKFIQVDGSATRRYGGSGLGLVISKHFVEMMGGTIEIESRGSGKGTSVIFTIPKWTKEGV